MSCPPPNQPRNGRSSYRDYLSERRRRAHAEAQVDADKHTSAQVIDHPLVCAGEPDWVDDNDQLAELIDQLRAARVFGYDTEFIGETHYPAKLCLVQLATADRIALVDPLAEDLDLEPMWRLLVDPDACPITHAGQPDLEPVVRETDRTPDRLFDTQLAAGLVGLDYPTSLANVVEQTLGVALPKSVTFTHWDERPMSPLHQRYAADDVRYLPALHAVLTEKLADADRADWAEQLFAEMRHADLYRFDPVAQTRRVLRQGSMPPRAFAVLAELVTVREQIARKRCLPPRAVMRNSTLIELARHRPHTAAGLRKLSLGKNQVDKFGDALLKAIKAGCAVPRDQLPPRHRPMTPAQRHRVDKIWGKLKGWCAEQDLPLQLLVSRKAFGSYARDRLRHADLDAHPLSHGWRAALVADKLDAWFA